MSFSFCGREVKGCESRELNSLVLTHIDIKFTAMLSFIQVAINFVDVFFSGGGKSVSSIFLRPERKSVIFPVVNYFFLSSNALFKQPF